MQLSFSIEPNRQSFAIFMQTSPSLLHFSIRKLKSSRSPRNKAVTTHCISFKSILQGTACVPTTGDEIPNPWDKQSLCGIICIMHERFHKRSFVIFNNKLFFYLRYELLQETQGFLRQQSLSPAISSCDTNPLFTFATYLQIIQDSRKFVSNSNLNKPPTNPSPQISSAASGRYKPGGLELVAAARTAPAAASSPPASTAPSTHGEVLVPPPLPLSTPCSNICSNVVPLTLGY